MSQLNGLTGDETYKTNVRNTASHDRNKVKELDIDINKIRKLINDIAN